MSEIVLETEGLTMEFSGFVAVRDVSLKVRQGSIHALIGPNGAGKTTFVNLLTGVLAPSAGRILLEGRDITAEKPDRRVRRGRSDAVVLSGRRLRRLRCLLRGARPRVRRALRRLLRVLPGRRGLFEWHLRLRAHLHGGYVRRAGRVRRHVRGLRHG